eukprot:CAMPEP_0176429258 /NCGR_PEP_ID=MMETSP0127-20121128/13615_1 /TAXON_ID=938130 /ORGANISM="Platyophrya macrostoma, Strain WH" /LENGTH=260 /DNA_ID=CAMNT_0017811051 /DNA_START=103 /DNA_END=885 /DNA_ORIENTATION=+
MDSKCKRKMKLGLDVCPAFDLSKIHEHSEPHDGSEHHTHPSVNAIDHDFLRQHGITHVLNVAKEVPPPQEQAAMESGDFTHKCIPLMDCHSEDIGEHFEEAFNFIEEARAQHGKVLVHCRRGISRSPAIVVGYLMRHEGFSYQDALQYVQDRRNVSLNLAFRTLLEEYSPTPKLLSNTCHKEEKNGPLTDDTPKPQASPSKQPSTATPKSSTTISTQSTLSIAPLANLRADSFTTDDTGLSAPESEISSAAPKQESAWDC